MLLKLRPSYRATQCFTAALSNRGNFYRVALALLEGRSENKSITLLSDCGSLLYGVVLRSVEQGGPRCETGQGIYSLWAFLWCQTVQG